MIIDDLQNSSRYNCLNALFAEAFDFIKSADFLHAEPGKHVLVEDELIVMVNDATLKPADQSRMEVHNEYIDIHVPLSSAEHFVWKRRSLLTDPTESFNKENDAQHFSDAPETEIDVPAGSFVIFYPEDAHVGCMGEGTLRKIIVKVRV